MLPTETIKALARELYQARKNRVQVRHFSRRHPEMTIDDGYAIQSEWVRPERRGRPQPQGTKIGLTSRAMQQASQISEPDYAPLMDDMFFAQGGDIPIARFIAPRVEVELAFILGKALRGPGISLFDVLAATEYVEPRRWRSSTPGSSSSTATTRACARSSTRSRLRRNAGRPRRSTGAPRRDRPALGRRDAVQERRGRGNRRRRRRPEPSGDRRGVAGEQDRAARRATERRRCRPRRLVHAADQCGRGDSIHADYGRLGTISFRFA